MRSLWLSLVLWGPIVVGCGSEQAPSKLNPPSTSSPVAFNADGAPTVELSVPGMMCEESCAKKVRELLAAEPGAVDVKVDFPAKKALVAVDPKRFDGKTAVAKLLDYGFDKTELIEAAH